MEDKKLTGYPSIDKPWLKYYNKKFDYSDIPDVSIYQLALDSNKDRLNNIAIDLRSSFNGFSRGIKITYKKLFSRIRASAKASIALGISKDELIPIVLPNIPEARILLYSNSIIGAISFPISPLMPPKQLERIIIDNNVNIIFLFKGFYEKYICALEKTNLKKIILLDGSESLPELLKTVYRPKNVKKNVIIEKNIQILTWHQYEHLAKKINHEIKPFYEGGHVTAVIGTSGTTGAPKGVCLTDRNINAAALSYINGGATEGSFLDALLPSIGYGISMLHYQTVDGRYVYLIPELITTNISKVLCQLKADNFPGGPVHYINIAGSEEFTNHLFPKFNNMISGGASLPHEIEKQLNGVDANYCENGVNEKIFVRQGYGLSENVAMGTYSIRGSYKFGSTGIPMPYLTIGIFKPGTDEELKYGENGEICISGPTVMKGYLNSEDETNTVIVLHEDGTRWIHTKDIGYMDEDGHLFHIDRIKNIFMRTGFNVHPAKIAEFINNIPFVRNCAVIGFPHPKEQCVPIAFVEINPMIANGLSYEECEEQLRNACFANLEETSVPYDYVFVNAFPINAGGKIDTTLLVQKSGINYYKSKSINRDLYF